MVTNKSFFFQLPYDSNLNVQMPNFFVNNGSLESYHYLVELQKHVIENYIISYRYPARKLWKHTMMAHIYIALIFGALHITNQLAMPLQVTPTHTDSELDGYYLRMLHHHPARNYLAMPKLELQNAFVDKVSSNCNIL